MNTGSIASARGRPVGRWPLFGLTLATLIAGPALAGTAASAGSGGSAGVTAPALPTGGSVQAGSASIGAPSGSSLTVTQTSSRAIINWTGFSIGSGGSVQFNNGSGATLNRVTGTSVSAIDGLLSGTGSVYLINPNGVIVGKDGVVSTGGTFAASTLDLTNSNFMAGGDLTFSGSSTASVVNEGKIGSLGGDVALIAAKVQNDGSISAAQGDVGLAAGYAVVLRDSLLDEGKFTVVVGGSDTAVTNTGAITAAEAELRANGGNVYALAGNTSSVIKATGVSTNDGKVFLVAENGAATAHGEIDATGQVETSGETVDFSGLTVKAASWLIDPGQIDLNATDAGILGADLATTDIILTTSSASAGIVGTTDDADALSIGDGDININGAITWGSSHTLTMTAYRSVNINAPITVQGAGKVVLNTDNDGGTGGDVTFGLGPSGFAGSISFTDTEGSGQALTINGTGYTLLYTMAEVQAINATGASLDGNFALANSLDAATDPTTPASWVPIGTDGGGNTLNSDAGFAGVFTGLGHTISNLTVNIGAAALSGPFGLSTGTIRDIGIVGGSVADSGGNSVGGLVGFQNGRVTDVYATDTVTDTAGATYVGGLVGYSAGSIRNAFSTGAVTVPGGVFVGGLLGDNAGGTVIDAHATGAVSATTAAEVGGLVGLNDAGGVIEDSYATGAVSAPGTDTVGGLVGENHGSTIAEDYATGDVTASGFSGGLIGENLVGSIVTTSYATGSVTGNDVSIGGLIGFDQAGVTDVYATGAVTGGASVGGLVGFEEGAIIDAYATGAVTVGFGQPVGGLVGNLSSGTITHGYYDSDTTGQPEGAQTDGSEGITTLNFEGVMPTFSNPTFWSTAPRLYPYLNFFYPNGATAIFGFAYSDAGLTPEASGATGPFNVSLDVNGVFVGTAATGKNGYYHIVLPADGVTTGNSLLVYTNSSATPAATYDISNGGIQDEELYGGALTVPAFATAWSAAPQSAALARSSEAALLSAAEGSDANAATAVAGAANLGLTTTSNFTVDAPITDTGVLVIATTGLLPLIVDSSITVDTGASLGLISNTSLAIEAPITVAGTGSVNLAYDGAVPTDLGFGLYPAGFAGSVSFAGAGALDINGVAYTLITSMDDLAAITDDNNSLAGNYALATSLDATGVTDWAPIGTDGHGGEVGNGPGFDGVFTGLGHTVSNLNVDTGTAQFSGLFGFSSGTIRDVGVVGGSVKGGSATGALAGWSTNAYDVYANTPVSQNVPGGDIGGLIGDNEGSLSDAFATGSVTRTSADNSASIGGLVGFNDTGAAIINTYATGNISVANGFDVGGLVGDNRGLIELSYATGQVLGSSVVGEVGGLVGGNESTGGIGQSYATGEATGSGFIGGLVGDNVGGIADAFALGAVVSSQSSGGALLGRNETTGIVGDTFATGYVNGAGGGLVGDELATSVTDSYYDATTTGQALGKQADNSVGLATASLQGALPTFLNPSFWTTGSLLYPYLNAFFPNGVQAISGNAYSSPSVSAKGAQVDAYSDGALLSQGAASSGANGYFYEIMAAGTLPSTGLKIGETITLAGATAVSGLHYVDDLALSGPAGAQVLTGTSVVSGLYFEQTDDSLDTVLVTDLVSTFGSANFSSLNTTLAATPLDLQAFGAFTVDEAFTRTGALEIEANGDLTISATGSLSSSASGDALILAANGNFINDAGSSAVSASSGRWLIYSQLHNSPTGAAPTGDVAGGLTAKSYYGDLFSFGSSAPGTFPSAPASGNRFVYGYQPTITVTADTKTVLYNGSDQTDSYTVGATQNGDAVADAVTGTPTGLTTPSPSAGHYTLTPAGLTSPDNYLISYQAGVLTIDPATITVSFVGAVQKVYDGTTTANLTSANYVINGLLPADAGAATLSGGLLGTYATKNQGTGILVTVNNLTLTLTGPDAGDYIVDEPNKTVKGNQTTFSLSAASGTITPIILTDALQGTVRKTYDGNNTATLTAANYKLTGKIIAGDNVTLNDRPSGTYNDANAATGKTVTVLGLALLNNPFGDYQLSNTSLSAAIGIIDPKVLTASLIGVVSKVYDGTTNATLTGANYSLTGGIIAGDTVSLTPITTGTYATTGQKGGTGILVTVRGLALSGAAAHNYVLSATTISASIGTITAH